MTSSALRNRPLVAILSAVALVILAGAIYWLSRAGHRNFEAFAADMSRGAYAAAAARLAAPSSLALQGDGSLLAIDRHRRSKTVAARQLPFLVTESPPSATDRGETLTLIALGPAKDGVSQSPPVQLRLTFGADGLQIDGID